MENNPKYCAVYTYLISIDSQWEFVTEFVLQQAVSNQISDKNGADYVL